MADHLERYIEAINPDLVQIENVVEFMAWGPMRIKCKKKHKNRSELCIIRDKETKKKVYGWEPISKKNGQEWLRWRNEIDAMGYRNEWRELNSADFGSYTSRNRLFGIFAKEGLPITWPEATHAKNPTKGNTLFDSNLKKWKPVKDKLDFTDEGASIFIDLYPKTEKAAYAYLNAKRKKKKKTDNDKVIVVFPASVENPMYGMEPKAVIKFSDRKRFDKIVAQFKKNQKTTDVRFYRYDPYSDATNERILAGLVKFVGNGDKAFISKYYSGRPAGKVTSIDSPLGAITTAGTQSLIEPEFLLKYNSKSKKGKYNPPSVNEPCPVIPTQGRLNLVRTEFLAAYYGTGENVSSVNEPCPVIPTKDRFNLVSPEYFIDKHYGKSQNQSINEPAGTIMPTDKHRLVEVTPFIMPTNYDNQPKSIEQPLDTITANRKYHYIVNPSHGGNCNSTDQPCPVIVARQDKAPLSLVQVIDGKYMIPIFESDSDVLVRIKMFMVAYGLVDIKMRMLRVQELKTIQGFPDDYVLQGNQNDQKKFIGNSVVPNVVKVWTEAMASRFTPNVIKMYKGNSVKQRKAA